MIGIIILLGGMMVWGAWFSHYMKTHPKPPHS